MAAVLRGLQAGRALRSLCSGVRPPYSCLRHGVHRTALLGIGQEPTPEVKASQSTSSYHYQAGSSNRDSGAQTTEQEGTQPNTSYAHQGGEESEDYETEEQLQARILTAALEFVPQHGWSVEAIAAGAQTLNLSTASAQMFPNGAGDLILFFIAKCNAQLTETLSEQHKQVQLGQSEPMGTSKFLRDAVETRLRMLIPYIDTWPQAMSILLLPHNLPDSLKHLSTLVDDIWYYAGDRSTDVSGSSPQPFFTPFHQHLPTVRPASAKMNWYTRRAALTGIYNTTMLVMVQDSSPDFQDTWNFLDNRIQDLTRMASAAKQVQSTGEAVVQGIMGAAVTLKNLTGVNQKR